MPTTPQLPPLPAKPTRFFCNKCGQIGDTQEHHRPHGPKCDYLAVGFVADGHSDATLHARDRQIVELCASIAASVGRPVGAGDGDTYVPVTSADASRAIRALLGDKGGM